jgi:Cu(I)/Ag(I) efflux system protein CusF
MKTLITAVLIAVASTSFAAQNTAKTVSSADVPWVLATVKKIDKINGRVVLAHAALPNGMPAMTMTFGVEEAALLDKMIPGQKIRFSIPADGSMTVTRFEPVK